MRSYVASATAYTASLWGDRQNEFTLAAAQRQLEILVANQEVREWPADITFGLQLYRLRTKALASR